MKALLIVLAGFGFTGTALAQTAAKSAPSPAPSALPRTAAAAGCELYFIAPQDGATVGQDVVVRFGLKGMGIAPAGMVAPNTGHHHLLIDVAELPSLDQPLINDEQHKHFGGGQTEASIKLTPGVHTLQLLLGDALHIPHQPPVLSKKITVTVK